jgi:1-acyl-sn-glycerol-3-phosphate acyltransferase
MNNNNLHKPGSPGVLQILASVYFWITLFLIPGFFFPVLLLVWILTVLFDRRLKILHQGTCFLSDLTLGANPYWKVKISGKEKIKPNTRYIFVSNHQSGADIMVLFKTHADFKWVAKKSLFFYPFIGWIMMMNRYIPIVRSRGRSKLQMMDRAIAAVREGNSLMMFPEGTRTKDGNLQPFKTGAFKAAMETHVPVLPVVIKGTYHAIRKGSLVINKSHHLEAVVMDPIPYEEFRDLQLKEIASKVHDLIRFELEKQEKN